MQQRMWVPEINKTLVCVDSYEKGVPVGRFYSSYPEAEVFESMSQFLLKMEESMDDRQMAQSYTAPRTFSSVVGDLDRESPQVSVRKGRKATFEIVVLFRQHTSWQGMIRWQEQQIEQSFRSVLELIRLMDSAMRSQEEAKTPA